MKCTIIFLFVFMAGCSMLQEITTQPPADITGAWTFHLPGGEYEGLIDGDHIIIDEGGEVILIPYSKSAGGIKFEKDENLYFGYIDGGYIAGTRGTWPITGLWWARRRVN